MVCISQTVSGPAIEGEGRVRIFAVTATVESQPNLFASLSVIVAGPAADHKTVMEVPFEGPLIVPPFTIHE